MHVLASLPLFFCYAAYPAVMRACEALGIGLPRFWIDAVWGLAGLWALVRLPGRAGGRAHFGAGAACVAVAAGLLRFVPQFWGDAPAVLPLLMEAKPLFYLGVAGLWCAAGLLPGRRAFVRWGMVLGLLLLGELAFGLAAGGGIRRPFGSGEINYDACLLLVSLCLSLDDERSGPLARGLLLVGLAATFSRTGLLSAVLVLTVFAKVSLRRRVLFFCLLSGCIFLSFSVRELSFSADALDRLWMWLSGLEMLALHPVNALYGFAPGHALPVNVPPFVAELWNAQSAGAGVSGVHAFHLHAMWLRLAVTWGAPAALILLVGMSGLAMSNRSSSFRALMLSGCIQGMTMGLLYLSNVALPFLFSLAAAMQNERPLHPERRGMRNFCGDWLQ